MADAGPAWVAEAIGGAPPARALALGLAGDPALVGKGGFRLTSPAFAHGGELDASFTACEEDAVAPPLEWTAPPTGSQELLLVVEDADSGALHWAVWGLAAQRGKLLEGETPPRTGKNAHGNSEWLLPDPKVGEERRYVFQMFALDLPLTLMPGATRDQVMGQIGGHVTAAAVLTARFEGHEVGAWDEDEAFEDEG